MALYFPRYHVALEVTDDPMSMPVDREAFPGLRVLSLTRAEVLDSAVLDRLAERMARDGSRSGSRHDDARTIRQRLNRVLDTSGIAEVSPEAPHDAEPVRASA